MMTSQATNALIFALFMLLSAFSPWFLAPGLLFAVVFFFQGKPKLFFQGEPRLFFREKSRPKHKRPSGVFFLGNNREGKAINLELTDVKKHMLIYGVTGFGKDMALQSLAYNAFVNGTGLCRIVSDGDRDVARELFTMARRFSRDDDFLHLDLNVPDLCASLPAFLPSNTFNFMNHAPSFIAFLLEDVAYNKDVTMLATSLVKVLDALKDEALPLTDLSFIYRERKEPFGSFRKGALGRGFTTKKIMEYLDPTIAASLVFPLKHDGSVEECDEVARRVAPELLEPLRECLCAFGYRPDAWVTRREIPLSAEKATVNGQKVTCAVPAALDLDGIFLVASLNNAGVMSCTFFAPEPGFEREFTVAALPKDGTDWQEQVFKLPAGESWKHTRPEDQGHFLARFVRARHFIARAISSLCFMYGHILNVAKPEIDMYDVIFDRRIMVADLPVKGASLQMTMALGRLLLSSIRGGMAQAFDRMIDTKLTEVRKPEDLEDILELPSPVSADIPDIIIIDNYALFMLPGFETVLSQGRSLGVAVILGAEGYASLEEVDPEMAEQAVLGTGIKVCMKLPRKETYELAKALFAGAGRLDEKARESLRGVSGYDLFSQIEGEFNAFYRGERVCGTFVPPEPKTGVFMRINRFLALDLSPEEMRTRIKEMGL